MRVKDLRAIVTGAASGMGRYFCTALCAEGAQVAAFDINEAGLADLAADVAGTPGALYPIRVNVARPDEVAEATAKAVTALGSVNGLINNAGIYRDGLLVTDRGGTLLKMPLPQWQAVIDVDLTGAFLMAREVATHMIGQRVQPGVIINIASVARHGIAGQSNYAAAKAGIVADSRVWALELAAHGIRVAAIAPGFIQTPILDAMNPGVLDDWIDRTPLKRIGTPDEIFSGLRFILECEFFTGKCLEIDGGLTP